jgi:hypothetical protein
VVGSERFRRLELNGRRHLRTNQLPTVNAPTIQLLVWIAEQTRSYAETIEVWKTSCPRLAVWEDALADDLVRVHRGCVLLTGAGRELLITTLPVRASR